MRKVYQNERSLSGVAIAATLAVGCTGVLFGVIPFAHRINKPDRTLELRKAGAVDLPPPADPTPPPQIEEQKPPEAAPEPKLSENLQAVPLSADLEVALGAGGALAGFGETQAVAAAATPQEETFNVADLEKRPEAVTQVAPAYPPELRKAKVEGVVTMLFVLDEKGRVEEPRVENSSRPEFEKPALDAIRKWRFTPGMKDGQPVRTFIRIPMRFRVTAG